MKVLFFGIIAELANADSGNYQLEGKNISEAKHILESSILGLSSVSYQLAVNQKIVSNSTQINNGDELAALPPFAGG